MDSNSSRQRKSRYGLSPVRFARLLSVQGHRCAVCRASLEDLPAHQVHVDHDHAHCHGGRSCGQCVRGIVCNGCNIRLGRIDTGTRSRNPKPSKAWTPDYAASLAAYLASPPAQQMPRRTVQVRAEEPEPIPVHPAPGSPGRPRSLTDEQAAELRELRAQGVTVTDVARRLGISRRSVYRYQG